MNLKMLNKIPILILLATSSIYPNQLNKETVDNKICDQKLQSCIKKCINEIEESRSAFRKGMCKDECAYNLKTQSGCLIYYNSSYK